MNSERPVVVESMGIMGGRVLRGDVARNNVFKLTCRLREQGDGRNGSRKREFNLLGFPIWHRRPEPASVQQRHQSGCNCNRRPDGVFELPRPELGRPSRVMDPEARPAHPDHRHHDVHERPAVPGRAHRGQPRLAAED